MLRFSFENYFFVLFSSTIILKSRNIYLRSKMTINVFSVYNVYRTLTLDLYSMKHQFMIAQD